MNANKALKVLTIASVATFSAQVLSNYEPTSKAMEGKMDRSTQKEVAPRVEGRQMPGDQTEGVQAHQRKWDRSASARKDEAKQHTSTTLTQKGKITKVQEALKNEGYTISSVDGVMGPETRSALKKYQSENGLEESGRLNEKTISAMNIKLDDASSNREDKMSDEVYSE